MTGAQLRNIRAAAESAKWDGHFGINRGFRIKESIMLDQGSTFKPKSRIPVP